MRELHNDPVGSGEADSLVCRKDDNGQKDEKAFVERGNTVRFFPFIVNNDDRDGEGKSGEGVRWVGPRCEGVGLSMSDCVGYSPSIPDGSGVEEGGLSLGGEGDWLVSGGGEGAFLP